MNLEYAKTRINDVAKPDSITTSISDFFATHVPMSRLQLLSTFEVKPGQSKYYSEEEIFENYVVNPNNAHQLLIVYGQSGTGKSHLIRWFNAKLEKCKQEEEILLFIERSNNTLKSTIKQLLLKPEVQNIPNKDVFDRLVKASAEMPENELKSTIYLSFITLIESDIESGGKKYDSEKSLTGNVRKRRLADYLRSAKTQELLSREDGPVERIYSKIAEDAFVGRDTVAEFKAKDFLDDEFNYEMQQSDEMTKGAQDTIMHFAAEDGFEFASKVAEYLNQMIPEVIQRCSGIQPGDFGEVFKEIRKELKKSNKKLTVFIEDITSFTGVDGALLNALIAEHTGDNQDMCLLNSIVGGTSAYIDSNFKQNHKDRVTKYVYIPSEAFDNSSLYEFFGKYLNAMSLPSTVFEQWADNGAKEDQYPVHEAKEGLEWDTVKLSTGQEVSLYPFTKNAVRNFYEYRLSANERIPRYILRQIIDPVVTEIINNRNSFPSDQFNFMSYDTKLNFAITTQGYDTNTAGKLLRFIGIWGSGKPEMYKQNDDEFISGISLKFFDEFNLPKPSFGTVTPPEPSPSPGPGPIPDPVVSPVGEKMREIHETLTAWTKGELINISSTGGTSGYIRDARKAMSEYLETAINWEAEGVPYDLIQKIKNSSSSFVTLTNTLKASPGLYTLSADNESLLVIEAFCQKVLCKSGWNYDGAGIDAYIITAWTEKHKKDIVSKVKYYDEQSKTPYKYIEPAICAELFRAILNGEYHDKTFKNISEVLYKDADTRRINNGHCSEWNNLLGYISQKDRDVTNKNTIKQYFNIRTGTDSASSFVVDTDRMEGVIKKLRASRFEIGVDSQQMDDPVRGRKEIYEYYNDFLSRIKSVVEREKYQAKFKLEIIENAFDDDEIETDDLIDICNKIGSLSNELNSVLISFNQVKTDSVKKAPAKIVEAIKLLQDIREEDDYLNVFLMFSNDPLGTISPLLELIDGLGKMLDGIEPKVSTKEIELKNNNLEVLKGDYSEQMAALDFSADKLGGQF